MVLDYNDGSASYATPRGHMGWITNADPNIRKRVIPHLEGGNISYADGHVKWQPGAKFITSYTDTTGTCVLADTSRYAFCDRAWNPFVP